jgi:hypothetical protein
MAADLRGDRTRTAPDAAQTCTFIEALDPDRTIWQLGAYFGRTWGWAGFYGPSRRAQAQEWIAGRYRAGAGVWLLLGDVSAPHAHGLAPSSIVGVRFIAATAGSSVDLLSPWAGDPLTVYQDQTGQFVGIWKLPRAIAQEDEAEECGKAAARCCVGRLSASPLLRVAPLPGDFRAAGGGRGSIVRMPLHGRTATPLVPALPVLAQEGYAATALALPSAERTVIEDQDRWLAHSISEALESQKITGGRIVGMTRGPLVTVCDYEPARSEKSARVVKSSNDVARLIKAASVIAREDTARGVVCFDVSNERRDIVHLRGVQASAEWGSAKRSMALPYILGVTSAGEPLIIDFAKAPHVLKAGSTGSGKSTGMNSGIVSLLEARGPDKLRVILIDPKRVELSIYGRHKQAPSDIPHLLAPIANDATKAAAALEWALGEMLRRYELLEEEGVSNVAEYNEQLAEFRAAGDSGVPDDMPRILIVIDEYAMLLQQAERRVKDVVRRLSAEARAAGIHILLATQHPSAKMMSGDLRTNFPVAVTYRMAKNEGSIVATGSTIARRLLGDGDGLLDRGDGFERIHAPYISKAEIRERLAPVRALGEPVFAFDYTGARPVRPSDAGSGYDDSGPVFDAGSGDFTPEEENEHGVKESPRGAAMSELCKIMPRGQQMRRADVWREMKACGHSKGTMDRASDDMGIDKVDGKGNDQLWTRP